MGKVLFRDPAIYAMWNGGVSIEHGRTLKKLFKDVSTYEQFLAVGLGTRLFDKEHAPKLWERYQAFDTLLEASMNMKRKAKRRSRYY